MSVIDPAVAEAAPGPKRGMQLLYGIIAMLAISSPQYVWALFVPVMRESLGATLAQIQVTIAIFSVCMCGLAPCWGWLAERMSARAFVAIGGVLTGLGWILASFATTLPMLYLTYGVITGVGVGMIFIASNDLATQWFPDRRGLAVGIVAGCYGLGAVVSTFPIDASINANGYQQTLLIYGIVFGGLCLLGALGMRKRTERDIVPAAPPSASRYSYTTREVLRTPAFWLLFVMMTLVATGGLMVISNIVVFARSFGIGPDVMVFGLAALPLALTVDRIANGVTRPLFGWISDFIGRENTMVFAFTLEAVSIVLLLIYGSNPLAFVLLSALVFLGFGEIFSLFPATLADIFGPKHQATNLGFLMITIAIASVIGGPLAALVFEATGSWTPVFLMVSGFDLIAAALAFLVLKPLRKRWVGKSA